MLLTIRLAIDVSTANISGGSGATDLNQSWLGAKLRHRSRRHLFLGGPVVLLFGLISEEPSGGR